MGQFEDLVNEGASPSTIAMWLRNTGHGGLICHRDDIEGDCACSVDELYPCEECNVGCKPATEEAVQDVLADM